MLRKNKFFFSAIGVNFVLFLIALAANLVKIINYDFFLPILLAQIIVLPNFAIGFSAVLWSLNKNEQLFLLFVFGGMLVRMIYLLGMVFLFLHFLKINQNYFIFDLFLFYFYFLIAEIFILVKQKTFITDKKT